MKIAAAHALAELAREDVPDEVAVAYRGARPRFGRDYIIPAPFDPRLIHVIPMAVAKAAMDSGVAQRPIVDMAAYQAAAFGAARSDRRRHAAHHRARAPDAEARRLRRGRGGAGDPRRPFVRHSGPRHGDPGRSRGPRARHRRAGRARSRREGHRDPQCAAVAAQRGLRAVPLRAAAAARLSVARLPAHDQSGPQLFRRGDGRAGRRRRDGDRRHPQLLDRARGNPARDRRQARPSRDRRFADPRARPSGRRRRHRDHRNAQRRGSRADRDRSGGRRAPPRLRAARRAARLLELRPPAGRTHPARAGSGAASSIRDASISNTTARWTPTSRSTAN